MLYCLISEDTVGQTNVANYLSGCFLRQILASDIRSQFAEICTGGVVLIIFLD